MARIRVGVAGCGNVSEHYLADLKRSPQVEVVSVCDVIEQRARRRAQEFDVDIGSMTWMRCWRERSLAC